MPDLPGIDANVYFGDPSKPPEVWTADDADDDTDADEPTPEERRCVIAVLGFDPDEIGDESHFAAEADPLERCGRFVAAFADDGRWVTIGAVDHHGGTPVHLDGAGKIDKGPAHTVGKAPHELGKAAEKSPEKQKIASTGVDKGEGGGVESPVSGRRTRPWRVAARKRRRTMNEMRPEEIRDVDYDEFRRLFVTPKPPPGEDDPADLAFRIVQDHMDYLKQAADFKASGENVTLPRAIGQDKSNELLHVMGPEKAEQIVRHFGLELGGND